VAVLDTAFTTPPGWVLTVDSAKTGPGAASRREAARAMNRALLISAGRLFERAGNARALRLHI